MFEKLRHNVALLALVGIALAISVSIAAGIGDRRARESLPPLRTAESNPILPVTREVRSALNLSDAFTSIASAITPGVVRIESEHIPEARPRGIRGLQRLLNEEDSTAGQPLSEVAGGSGFIISDNGYIVTNNHVIEDADVISVRLFDKRVVPARLVGRDPLTDIALLKIDAPDLRPVRFGDSDNSSVGEWVLAIGNPGFGDSDSNLDFTVTSGIISAKGRPLQVLNDGQNEISSFAIEDFIQTDAAINPGNSGGPLLNLRGEVVGMNTAIASSNGFNQGYAFAIPANLVQRIARDLADFGYVRRPMLGVQIEAITHEDAEVYKLPEISGVLVEDFRPANSPARKAGLRRGDVIVKIDGKKVDRVGQLQGLVAQHRPGETVEAQVYRDGKPLTFSIRLDETPHVALDDARDAKRSVVGGRRLGIQVGELTAELARQYGFDRSGGAVITDVQPMSVADRRSVPAPARIVTINGREVKSGRDAQTILRGLRSGQIVSLTLEAPDGRMAIRNVRLP